MQPQRAEPPSPQTGDIVAGKYRLERPIGLGAMGLVFEARHLRLQQRVAIKFMQPKLIGQVESVARFEREGRAASRLTSIHSTRIIDVDATSDGLPYIVSELLEGRDLRQELDERERLPIEEAVGIVIQACAAMAEAHAFGIVHRDLKPSNLFLARTTAGRVVKVLDFGISKMEEELELTTTGIMLGSPRYMAPEQVEARRVDRRADLWALGVILYRAISGVYPFEGNTSISLALAILTQPPRDIVPLVPEAPPALVAAIRKALTVDLDARHATARDLAEAIAPFAAPEAAALARSLTREVSTAEHSRPSLDPDVHGAATMTQAKSEVDALISVSLEPPEQATRGTWSEASQRVPPPEKKSRALVVGLAAVGAAVVFGLGVFAASGLGGSASSAAVSSASAPSAAAPPPAADPPPTATEALPSPATAPSAPPSASASSPVAAPPRGSKGPSSRPAPAPPNPPAKAAPPPPPAPAPAPPPTKNPTYL